MVERDCAVFFFALLRLADENVANSPHQVWWSRHLQAPFQLVDYKQFKGQAHRTTEYESVGDLSDK